MSDDRLHDEYDKLAERAEELENALKGVMKLIGDGVLVRNTSDDANPGWALKMMPLVATIKAADSALEEK